MGTIFSLNFTSTTPGGEFYVTSWAECCACGVVPSCFLMNALRQQYGGNGEPIPALGSFLHGKINWSWMQVNIKHRRLLKLCS